MEKKRKLPARAAAREQSSKKRNISPVQRSETPVPPPAEPTPDPKTAPVDEPPPSLPTSITPGKPLPTVETPQPEDLSMTDYQSIQESGVLAESLARSRSKWVGMISEGIFEKYWSKPTKKRGVVHEDANNPPKDSMMKLGPVTITVPPHMFEATMFAVKDLKPPSSSQLSTERPVLQYGPPNGVMPSLTRPKSVPPAEAATLAHIPSQPQTPGQAPPDAVAATQSLAKAAPHAHAAQPPHAQTSVLGSGADGMRPATNPAIPRPPAASPRGMESFLTPTSVVPQPPLGPPSSVSAGPSSRGGLTAPVMTSARPAASTMPAPGPKPQTPSAPDVKSPAKPAAPGADPIILTLAERAGEDPELRDLMKKVAQGEAQKDELERFQSIIDTITAESRRKVAVLPADRLLVDKRSVQYYAEEVHAIINIVLQSNPKQTSATLKPPEGSNPLVIALVKLALDDPNIKSIITRIANRAAVFSDTVDLKAKLDELYNQILKERERAKPQLDTSAATLKANGLLNGQTPTSTTPQSATPAAQQALRSKGPPPALKADISAIVFEFAGGNGDRYLFPKFSILDTKHTLPPPQQQVVASFLLVRRGSKSEYPLADPEMDYYEPLTIRLFTSAGRHLEQLARVVAPEEEVRRYMDDVMERMTRGEYLVLAMKLPRPEKDGETNSDDREKGSGLANGGLASKQALEVEPASQPVVLQAPQPPPQPVLWRGPKPEIREVVRPKAYRPMDVDDQYQSFIASVKRKENKDV
ncbi:hypothetical protein V8F33_007280 [Rhypophila sp. PSN 637]